MDDINLNDENGPIEEFQTQVETIEDKEQKVLEYLAKHDSIPSDILKTLAIWGLSQINDPNVNETELRDICNKISECNVAIANIVRYKDSADISVIKNALLSWIVKDPTPQNYKAKYR